MKPYLLLMLIIPSFVECEQRRVVASGKVTCDGKPYKGAKVKIISKKALMDNTYGSVYSDENGEFNIDGTMDEIFAPDAELKIYHDCDDGLMPCQRRLMFHIPKTYFNPPGTVNPKKLDLGVLNLSLKAEKEERDCFH